MLEKAGVVRSGAFRFGCKRSGSHRVRRSQWALQRCGSWSYHCRWHRNLAWCKRARGNHNWLQLSLLRLHQVLCKASSLVLEQARVALALALCRISTPELALHFGLLSSGQIVDLTFRSLGGRGCRGTSFFSLFSFTSLCRLAVVLGLLFRGQSGATLLCFLGLLSHALRKTSCAFWSWLAEGSS